jgi:hypothetical protein
MCLVCRLKVIWMMYFVLIQWAAVVLGSAGGGQQVALGRLKVMGFVRAKFTAEWWVGFIHVGAGG